MPLSHGRGKQTVYLIFCTPRFKNVYSNKTKSDRFTKTGSGRAQETLRKKGRCFLAVCARRDQWNARFRSEVMKKKHRPFLCSIRLDHSCIFCASKENDDLPRQARGKRQEISTVQTKGRCTLSHSGKGMIQVRKTPLFEQFSYNNHHVTKTGSGQT